MLRGPLGQNRYKPKFSGHDTFPFRYAWLTKFVHYVEKGNIKNTNVKAKPKWIALAGKPLNMPISNQKGNGEAYQSWNKVQTIAIEETIFKWMPVRFLVGDKSSEILFVILFLKFSFISMEDTL